MDNHAGNFTRLQVFMDNCAGCHDPDERKGGLDLTTFASARAGGASGTTIIPGDAELSRLYLLVSHQEKPTMPPQEPKIADEKIQLIRKWILGGAPESKADGQAFAAKKKKAQSRKGVAMVASFDKPAPLPSNWHAIEPTPTLRPVAVTSIATSNRSELVAIPGLRQVFMLDSKTRKTLGVLPFIHGDVEVIRFSADCSQLLVGGGLRGKRGRVSLFNIADGKTYDIASLEKIQQTWVKRDSERRELEKELGAQESLSAFTWRSIYGVVFPVRRSGKPEFLDS